MIDKENTKTNLTNNSDFHLRNIWNDVNCIKYHVQTISVSLVAIAVTLVIRLLIFPLIGLA